MHAVCTHQVVVAGLHFGFCFPLFCFSLLQGGECCSRLLFCKWISFFFWLFLVVVLLPDGSSVGQREVCVRGRGCCLATCFDFCDRCVRGAFPFPPRTWRLCTTSVLRFFPRLSLPFPPLSTCCCCRVASSFPSLLRRCRYTCVSACSIVVVRRRASQGIVCVYVCVWRVKGTMPELEYSVYCP